MVNMNSLADPLVHSHFEASHILVNQISHTMHNNNISSVTMRDYANGNSAIEIHNKNNGNILRRLILKAINLIGTYLRVMFGSLFGGLIWISLWIMLLRGVILVGEGVYRLTGSDLLQRHVPFLNEYLLSLRTGRKARVIKYFVLGYFLVSFLMFYGFLMFVNELIRDNLIGLYSRSDNKQGLVYLVIIEAVSWLVLRTRTSIKYSPFILMGIHFICQFVCSMHPYILPSYNLTLSFQLSLIYLLSILLTVESGVSSSGDPLRPTIDHPRCLYFPNCNLSWHSTVPPIWTYFVPPHARKFFTSGQLSYVDANYQRLYCILVGIPYNEENNVEERGENVEPPGRREMDGNDMILD